MRLNAGKKKIEKKYIIIMIILGVCLTIGIVSLMVRDDRQLTFIEKGIKDVLVKTENILYTPIRFFVDKIDNYNEMKRIYNKYKDIDNLESKTTLLEEENKELKRNLDELKETLELNKIVTDYETINTTVINRNVGNWYNTLTVDKGEKSGVETDMIVITNKGLIGKVIKTTFYTCEIKLITTSDLNNKISVSIVSEEGNTYGLLSGYNKDTKKLMITDIIDGTIIKEGDKVITSGLSDVFPKGVVVGTVSTIESDEFGISKIIKVIPAADFNKLTYVTVLKGVN